MADAKQTPAIANQLVVQKGTPAPPPSGALAIITNDGTTPLLQQSDGSTSSLGGGSGITALTGDVTAAGTGSVAATLANLPSSVLKALLATMSGPGFLYFAADGTPSKASFYRLAPGADLGDADANISPFVDKASQYVIGASAPLTANRTYTLQNTSAIAGSLLGARIIRKDTGAFNAIIKNSLGSTVITLGPASGSTYQYLDVYYNGTTFAANTGGYVQNT